MAGAGLMNCYGHYGPCDEVVRRGRPGGGACPCGTAHAQSVKPKYPGEIAAASNRIAEKNEDCRRQAREQHLHLVKRYRFIRDCKRQRP